MIHPSPKKDQKRPNLSSSFEHFLASHTQLDLHAQNKLGQLLSQPLIHKTVHITLILLVWMMVSAVIEITLLGGGIFASLADHFSVFYFLPNIFFALVNAMVKYHFIAWFDKDTQYYSHYVKLVMIIPSFGMLLALPLIWKDYPELSKVFRLYMRYLKKKGVRSILELLKRFR